MQNDSCTTAQQPLVSVVVPVYNIERNLDECIDSLVKQTHTNLEIILVNDGSSDASPTICDSWTQRDSRIRVIHQANAGPSAARNNGLNQTAGAFVAFVDGDDYCAESYIEVLLHALETSNADMSLCSFNRINAGGCLYDPRAIPEIDKGDLEDFLALMLHDDLFPAPWAKLFTADCAKRIYFDESVRIGEDVRMWNKLARDVENLSFCTINETLYHYRDSDSSIVSSYHAEREQDIVESWDMLCDTALSRFGSAMEPHVRFRRSWMWFEALDRAVYFGETTNNDYCDEAVRYLRAHADDVYETDVFTKGRKAGMRVLSISKPLYIAIRRMTKKRA